jgi:hypothetical protein
MTIQVDISNLEDEVLNSLNSILLITYGSDVYKDVEKEIRRVVATMENAHLIHKRRRIRR